MIEIINLYYPVIISVLLLFLLAFKKLEIEKKSIPVSLFEVVKFDLPISHINYIRAIIIILCFIPLYYSFSRDYSAFFPKEFSMEVFYDNEGILDLLDTFDEDELSKFKISKDLDVRDTHYFRILDEEIRNNSIAQSFFTKENCTIHSSGNTTFRVEKVDGFQKYHIYESKGELQHFLDCPQEKQLCIKSFFEKLPSNNDYLNTRMSSIILRPKFKQTIAEKNKSDGIIFNHVLYGITKIKIFPTITYSNTLYLFEYKDSLYPIGYAVYRK